MPWFVFEICSRSSTTTELEQFPLLEAALKYGIDELMLVTRNDKQVSIALGAVRGARIDWLGGLRLDDENRPSWTFPAASNGLASMDRSRTRLLSSSRAVPALRP